MYIKSTGDEYLDKLYSCIDEQASILFALDAFKLLNFSQDDENHKRLSKMRGSIIFDNIGLMSDVDSLKRKLTKQEFMNMLIKNVLDTDTYLTQLIELGILKFSEDNKKDIEMLKRILDVTEDYVKVLEDTSCPKDLCMLYYRLLLQALHKGVIKKKPDEVNPTTVPQEEPEVKEPEEAVHTETPQEEPEVKEPEEAVHTTVPQKEPEVKEPEEPVHTEAPQEEAGESTVKKSEYSFYNDFGIDIGAIRFLTNMSDGILLKTEVFLKKYIEQYNKVTGFKLSKGFILNYRYKKAQHIVYDWLESIRKTGSLSPLEDEDDEEMQWLYFCSFHSIEEIRGMTSLIISSAYNVICPPPSKTKADRFQLGRWHCQKEIVLQAAKAEIEEFGRYLWEKVKEV